MEPENDLLEQQLPTPAQIREQGYTLLVPTMLPTHFKIMEGILRSYGYKAELLENSGESVVEHGLKYVHNDTCYPALLVIGQLLSAIESGRYDKHRLTLLITQTGGGCRASNYIRLLRKALAKAGYGYIPVLSLNLSGLEKNSTLPLDLGLGTRLLLAALCGDLLMLLRNQVKPYETEPGAARALERRWVERLAGVLSRGSAVSYFGIRRIYRQIVRDFAAIPVQGARKVRVGIVGEIFVKFSPLGNNELEEFLAGENTEVVMPGLIDFCMYCAHSSLTDARLFGLHRVKGLVFGLALELLEGMQKDLIRAVKASGRFDAPTPFAHVARLAKPLISPGAKMGEGWLLTGEMVELIEQGVNNIVCVQPFGCLPNHIVGKGMLKPLKERYPEANIVAVDYDAAATRINQENRIKLMLSNAALQA